MKPLSEMKAWAAIDGEVQDKMLRRARALVKWTKRWQDQVVSPWDGSRIGVSSEKGWFEANGPMLPLIDKALLKALKELREAGVERPLTLFWVAVGTVCQNHDFGKLGSQRELAMVWLLVRVRNTAHLVHEYNQDRKNAAKMSEIVKRGLAPH
jgi:hypothetical protein